MPYPIPLKKEIYQELPLKELLRNFENGNLTFKSTTMHYC